MRILDDHETGVDDFAEVVRRDVRGHADGDTRGAVDEQVRILRRQYRRLALGAVVVGDEIDGLFVDVVAHQLFGEARQADFGVTHCRRIVAVDGAEVALAVDEPVAHREVLRHAHDGVVDRAVAVRVVFTHHVADDARRFLVRLAGRVALLVHPVKDAAVHRLQAVADVRQRAADDDRHRVVEIRLAHLVFDIDGIALLVVCCVIEIVAH